ncbi:P-loop containing nucleoside triphosphate hydrolase protein [Parasitella parasitica]|nr:P-loop containing nucleoside triphosphate hydrolase protein [Parasitella parasitica]
MNTEKLRDYQDRCIKDTLASIKKGQYQHLISLPTGSGKTVVMSNLIPLIPSPNPKATKVLVLGHRIELLNQAKAQISKYNPKLVVNIEQEKNLADPLTTDVVIGSVQSLNSKDKKDKSKYRMNKFDPKLFKAVIVDEAHRGVAKTYMRIFEYFGVLEKGSKTLLWGCTATPKRADKKSLDPVFGPVSFHLGLMEMISIGYLSDLRVTTVDTDDFLDEDIYHEVVIASWQQFAAKKQRTSTLVFARNIQKTEDLCDDFISKGVDAKFITSKTDPKTRTKILDDFKEGKVPVLVNCTILTEGTDLPQVDCILLTRKTNSEPLFQQMLGRGSRLHEDKQDCLIIDFKKNFERLLDGMMTGQDDLDEQVNAKKKVVKKSSGKEQDIVDKYEDKFVVIHHYKNLQHMIDQRKSQKEAKEQLANALVDSKKKSKIVAEPSLDAKIRKHLDGLNVSVKSFVVPS